MLFRASGHGNMNFMRALVKRASFSRQTSAI